MHAGEDWIQRRKGFGWNLMRMQMGGDKSQLGPLWRREAPHIDNNDKRWTGADAIACERKWVLWLHQIPKQTSHPNLILCLFSWYFQFSHQIHHSTRNFSFYPDWCLCWGEYSMILCMAEPQKGRKDEIRWTDGMGNSDITGQSAWLGSSSLVFCCPVIFLLVFEFAL